MSLPDTVISSCCLAPACGMGARCHTGTLWASWGWGAPILPSPRALVDGAAPGEAAAGVSPGTAARGAAGGWT